MEKQMMNKVSPGWNQGWDTNLPTDFLILIYTFLIMVSSYRMPSQGDANGDNERQNVR